MAVSSEEFLSLTMFAMSMDQRIEHLHTQGDAVVEAVITGNVNFPEGHKANHQSGLKSSGKHYLFPLASFLLHFANLFCNLPSPLLQA